MAEDAKLERVKLKRKDTPRVPLDRTRKPLQSIDVISSGYGKLMGEMLVGRLVGVNSRAILLEFKDEDGPFVERYHPKSGTRISDLGDRVSGWRLSEEVLDQIDAAMLLTEESLEEDVVEAPDPKLVLLSREEIPYRDNDKMVIEVWQDDNTDLHYSRMYRTGVVGKGALKKERHWPCVVPFSILRQILYDFESNHDDLPQE